MPHSYGASFSGVGRFGPTRLPSAMLNTANPAPRPIMIRMGSQPCMLCQAVARTACESFLNRSTSECYHTRFGPGGSVEPGVPQPAAPRGHDIVWVVSPAEILIGGIAIVHGPVAFRPRDTERGIVPADAAAVRGAVGGVDQVVHLRVPGQDRKSTRLNSSH